MGDFIITPWFFLCLSLMFLAIRMALGLVDNWPNLRVGKHKRRALKAKRMAERNKRLLEVALDNHAIAMKERKLRHRKAIEAFDEQLGIFSPSEQDEMISQIMEHPGKRLTVHLPAYVGGKKWTACFKGRYNPATMRVSSNRDELSCKECIWLYDRHYAGQAEVSPSPRSKRSLRHGTDAYLTHLSFASTPTTAICLRGDASVFTSHAHKVTCSACMRLLR